MRDILFYIHFLGISNKTVADGASKGRSLLEISNRERQLIKIPGWSLYPGTYSRNRFT